MPPDPAYDALLVVSFGGPEGPDDVMPFLENVTRGRAIPPDRLASVAEHYLLFGGVSPINQQCRDLVAAVGADLAAHGLSLPVYWGNRNWDPMLADTLRRMTGDGVRRALAFVTSAYSSYPGCRQYREDLAAARDAAGPGAPRVDKLRHYFNHPGFVEPTVDNAVAAVDRIDPGARANLRLAFVTHSLPSELAEASGPDGDAYVHQHREVARLVVDGIARATGTTYPWDLVYCSRSGSSQQPWLGPDVGDHLEALAVGGASAAVLVPIGFVSDHLEVRYDLDTEASRRAAQVGLPVARAATVGTDPRFVAMVRELVVERVDDVPSQDRRSVGRIEAMYDVCPRGCCPNPRGPRPAVAGAD